MRHPQAIQESITKFRKDYPNPERVGFLMMRFADKSFYPKLVESLKKSFEKERISLVRADDKEYHSDLFTNIQTYMHGCGFGVAVFDKIGAEDFNPNVSLEVGYMMSMNKDILFLKEKEERNLSEDLIGKLYKNFNSYDIKNTIPKNVFKWLNDKELCFSCAKCYVELGIEMSELVSNQDKVDDIICDLIGFCPTDNKPKLIGVKPNVDNKNAILVFEGDIEFFELLIRLKKSDRLRLHNNDINIIDIKGNKPYDPIQIIRSGKHTWQICYAENWDGDSSVIYNAYAKLGNEKVFEIEKCKVYLTKSSDDYLVAISNLICFGKQNATKIRAPLWMQPKDNIRMIDILSSITAYKDLLTKPSENEIIFNNVKNVEYLIDKNHSSIVLSKIDFCGAENIQII